MARKKAQKNVRQHRSCRETIVRRMTALGTYRQQFGATIDRLAELYVQMDELMAEFAAEGRQMLVEHTNKAGATNVQANPLLNAWQQTQAQALAVERELGLTPAAMSRLGVKEQQPKKSALELAMERLTAG